MFMIRYSQESCTIIADYKLDGLSTSLTSFPSSVDAANQPSFSFVSSGGNGNYANPVIASRGLSFVRTGGNSKYVKITGPWKQNSQSCTGINFWIFRSYQMGYIARVALQSTDAEGRCFYIHDGWNFISVELCSNYQLNLNVCQQSGCSGMQTFDISSYQKYQGNEYLFFGCGNSCNSYSSYLLYNFRVTKNSSPCASNPLSIAFLSSLCGNGVRDSGETCDDANMVEGDGCSEVCDIESGYTCNYYSVLSADQCDYCGNGRQSNVETCDDGNAVPGDCCSSSCLIETNCVCYDGGWWYKSTCEVCGDGIRKFSSGLYNRCDDGNTNNGDGCSSTCYTESGWTCTGGSSTTPDFCEVCGDGKRFTTNTIYCDDGNKIYGDGCSSGCFTEYGWNCTGGTSTTPDVCSEKCGDGRRYNTNATYCDDYNTNNGDGCSSTCTIEDGFTCSGGNSYTRDTCKDICGDGRRFVSNSTFCDDGNTQSGDGCSSTCTKETGWYCYGGTSTSPDKCNEICGDGIRFGTGGIHYCDDGNNINGDGCSSSCIIEDYYSCTGGDATHPDICYETCGDGRRFNTNSNYCDDGNTRNGDGCSSTCTIETDFICAGGSSKSPDKCYEICGNGIRASTYSLYCDDGNKIDGDGCDSNCRVEFEYACTGGSISTADSCKEICGDGIKLNTNKTYCDDGNTINYDGCSSSCLIEDKYICSGGSVTSKDICVHIYVPSPPIVAATSSTQAAAGVGASVSAGTSLISMSSPIGIFSMINQFQLLLLLLCTGAYISDEVSSFIKGMSFTMLNFSFLKLENISFLKESLNYLSFPQNNLNLDNIGLSSGNTFINIYKLLLMLALLIILHLCLIPILRKVINSTIINSRLNTNNNKTLYNKSSSFRMEPAKNCTHRIIHTSTTKNVLNIH